MKRNFLEQALDKVIAKDLERQKNQFAVELGRLGGKSKSKAKKKASRENGKKGGRPKTKN